MHKHGKNTLFGAYWVVSAEMSEFWLVVVYSRVSSWHSAQNFFLMHQIGGQCLFSDNYTLMYILN